jgi:hypothetical protein
LAEPKTVAEMMGEMFREAAVLVLVFVPLEVLGGYHFTLGWTITSLIVETTAITCVVLATIGMWIERRREVGR